MKNIAKSDLIFENIQKRTSFFEELKNYFKQTNFNGLFFDLKYSPKKEYAYIYNSHELMINVRIKNGFLNDICVFLEGDYAKQKFDFLEKNKNQIESELGYKLVWDRNNNRKACRIGKFGKYMPKQKDNFGEIIEGYTFDLDVQKVAAELVLLHNVFVPKLLNFNESLTKHSC